MGLGGENQLIHLLILNQTEGNTRDLRSINPSNEEICFANWPTAKI